MIPNENKIGLVPRLIVAGKWGPREYAVLVTDQRTILVLEKESKAGVGAAFGAAGAIIAGAAAKSRSFDYSQLDPQSLAADTKNLAITHSALSSIRLKKRMMGSVYWMEFHYQNSEGKIKKFKGLLTPPGVHTKQRKSEGTGRKQIYYDYAKKAQDLYQSALPTPRFQSLINGALQ